VETEYRALFLASIFSQNVGTTRLGRISYSSLQSNQTETKTLIALQGFSDEICAWSKAQLTQQHIDVGSYGDAMVTHTELPWSGTWESRICKDPYLGIEF